LCATSALEGGDFLGGYAPPFITYSDQDGTRIPDDGKWWAHMGWILMGKSMHHDTTR